jgi:hypothetical protein
MLNESTSMKRVSILATFLKALAKTLYGVGGASFLVGGGLIHAVMKMDRFTAELVGIGIAGACLILGILVNEFADRLTYRQENASISPG